jgi:uncharacterized LabA/DUF88 family protein
MEIGCFLDYDNLTTESRKNGILDVITRIINNFDPSSLDKLNRLDIRLYGGWYDTSGNLTTNAINLSNELTLSFPHVLNVKDFNTNEIKKINCKTELAYSLLEIPGDILHSTFRSKRPNNGIKCIDQNSIGCIESNCLAGLLHNSLKKKKCTIDGCGRPLDELIQRNEQKMVDTFLGCDLLYALNLYNYLILISSDDDFVPFLKTISNKTKNILHVETKSTSNQIGKKFSLDINTINL